MSAVEVCPCRRDLKTSEVATQVDTAELEQQNVATRTEVAIDVGSSGRSVAEVSPAQNGVNNVVVAETVAGKPPTGRQDSEREVRASPVANRPEPVDDHANSEDLEAISSEISDISDADWVVADISNSTSSGNNPDSSDPAANSVNVALVEEESSDSESSGVPVGTAESPARPVSRKEINNSASRQRNMKNKAENNEDKVIILEYFAKLKELHTHRNQPNTVKIPPDVQLWLNVLTSSRKDKEMYDAIKKMHLCYQKYKAKKGTASLDQLKDLMSKTFLLRYEDLYNIKSNFTSVLAVYPGLKVFKCLKQEYDLVYKRRKRMKELSASLSKYMRDSIRHVNAESLKSSWAKDALTAWEKNPDYSLMTKAIIGVLLHADLKTRGKAFGTTLQTAGRPGTNQPVIYLKIEVGKDKVMWDPRTKVTIFFEQKALSTVSGVWKGLMMIYAYYWVLYINYSDVDRKLFEIYEEKGGAD